MSAEDVAVGVFDEGTATPECPEIELLRAKVGALEIRNGELTALIECRRRNLGDLIGATEQYMLHMHDLAHRRFETPEEMSREAGKALRDLESAVNYARVVGLGMAARIGSLFPQNDTNGEMDDGSESDSGSRRRAKRLRG